jgi:hypothetical protein
MRLSFTEHPASVGESYLEHMAMALSFAGAMLVGGLACLAHAFLPFLCERTGSSAIAALHERMVQNRVSARGAERLAADAATQPQG